VSSPHRLLAVLGEAINNDPAPPGFSATLAFGVRQGDETHWWEVTLDKKAKGALVGSPDPTCDGVLLLGATDADAIVRTGHLPDNPKLVDLRGDRELLGRFVKRYLVSKSSPSVRGEPR